MFIRWTKPKYRIEIDRGAGLGNPWFWRHVSAVNGQTIATSEIYSSRDACEQTAYAVSADTGWPIVVTVMRTSPLGKE